MALLTSSDSEDVAGTPDARRAVAPKVVFWFRVYTAAWALVYALAPIAGGVCVWHELFGPPSERLGSFFLWSSAVLAGVGILFPLVFLLPFFLPRKPWVYVYDLVIICVGMAACIAWPASIPLLIYWIKPDVKLWFNRT